MDAANTVPPPPPTPKEPNDGLQADRVVLGAVLMGLGASWPGTGPLCGTASRWTRQLRVSVGVVWGCVGSCPGPSCAIPAAVLPLGHHPVRLGREGETTRGPSWGSPSPSVTVAPEQWALRIAHRSMHWFHMCLQNGLSHRCALLSVAHALQHFHVGQSTAPF